VTNKSIQTLRELLDELGGEPTRASDITAILHRQYELHETEINAFTRMGDNISIKTDGWLGGLPISIKDQFHQKGWVSQFGLGNKGHRCSSTSASVVKNLLDAGADIRSHTRMPPYAMDFQTVDGDGKRTNNPFNAAYTAGGSSGGGAAAVSSGMSLLDVGADLSGSLRLPASFCGVYSLLPSEGELPTDGMLADPSANLRSFARPGPIGRHIDDLWLAFCAMRADQTLPPVLSQQKLSELNLAIWTGDGPSDLDTRRVFSQARNCLAQKTVMSSDLPSEMFDVDTMHLFGKIMGYETGQLMPAPVRWISRLLGGAARNKSPRFLNGVHQGYAMNGKEYETELKKRAAFQARMAEELSEVDALLLPVSPVAPFKHVNPCSDSNGMRDYDHVFALEGTELGYFDCLTYYTVPISLLGFPVVTLPMGMSKHGLPIGGQLVGKLGQEKKMLEIAAGITSALEVIDKSS